MIVVFEETMKICTGCEQELPVDRFNKSSTTKDGLQYRCKECIREYYRNHKIEIVKYRLLHKIERAEYRRKYRQSHKTEIIEHHKKYRQTLNGCLRDCFYSMVWRCTNPNAVGFEYWGGKGIKVKFTFEEFVNYVTIDLGFDTVEKFKGFEIHRIDNDGHYKIGNIKFLTKREHRSKHKEIRSL